MSDEEQKNIVQVFKAAEQGGMRLPFQIALLISPLALLVPVRLHANRYSQANLVMVRDLSPNFILLSDMNEGLTRTWKHEAPSFDTRREGYNDDVIQNCKRGSAS